MFVGFKEVHSAITSSDNCQKGHNVFLSLSDCILEFFLLLPHVLLLSVLSCFGIKPYILILCGHCFQNPKNQWHHPPGLRTEQYKTWLKQVMAGMCGNYINKLQGSTVKGRSVTLSKHKMLSLFFWTLNWYLIKMLQQQERLNLYLWVEILMCKYELCINIASSWLNSNTSNMSR